jgi:hypothetical protein
LADPGDIVGQPEDDFPAQVPRPGGQGARTDFNYYPPGFPDQAFSLVVNLFHHYVFNNYSGSGFPFATLRASKVQSSWLKDSGALISEFPVFNL